VGPLVLIAIFVWMQIRGHSRSKTHVELWAKRNGLHVDSIALRWNPFGPFFFKSNAQRVYDVTFVDGAGRARPAIVRVGGFFGGSLVDDVRVVWR